MQDRLSPLYPAIAPIADGIDRPFWSVMIPTYNGTEYLEQTICSVLAQDPGAENMQIMVIDDCSTKDDPEPLVQALGQGRISFLRQPHNRGQIPTWNHCLQQAQGHWIHLLHQDDFVLPDFYQALGTVLRETPQVGAAFCRHRYIDERDQELFLSQLEQPTSGILLHWIEKIATAQRVQFPSIVVNRNVYEHLGGFCPEARSAADWEMWKRIAAHYAMGYEPEVLACFRLHSASESSRLIKTGENIADTRRAIELSRSYLPDATTQNLTHQAQEYYAIDALNRAYKLCSKGDVKAAIAQLQQGLKCSISPPVLYQLLNLMQRGASRWVSKSLSPKTLS
jgi:glycosyltransferase involved in cell wall biosynthesis